jgi:hypothetical protein
MMNATAEQLDQFLREADANTARTVEQIVRGLLAARPNGSKTTEKIAQERVPYELPARSLGARRDLDLTKLAHADEDI